jgi:hypothetical protein
MASEEVEGHELEANNPRPGRLRTQGAVRGLPCVKNVLGGALLGQKKYAEAGPLLLQGSEGMKQAEARMTAHWRYRLTEAGERLIRSYEETNQPEKAREWQERLQKDKSKK